MRNATLRRAWLASVLLAATTLLPTVAHAQAWLPDRGQGTLYVGYQYGKAHWELRPVDVSGAVFGPYTGGPGNKLFQGEHYGQSVTVDLDYGIGRGSAVSAHIAHVASKYDGRRPHTDQNGQVVEVDNGHYHSTFQDAEMNLRRTVLRRPFLVTPFVGYRFPVQRYATLGHGALGHHLRELRLGGTLARSLSPFLPDAYGLTTYTYALAEREDDHTLHRNGIDMELGYFVTPRLSLKGAASWVRTSGGIEWILTSPDFIEHRFSHDPLANERSWRIGGGAGYVLTPRFTLYLIGFATVSGANTHAMNTLSTGIGWNFTTPWAD
jgi:hypothetical protein